MTEHHHEETCANETIRHDVETYEETHHYELEVQSQGRLSTNPGQQPAAKHVKAKNKIWMKSLTLAFAITTVIFVGMFTFVMLTRRDSSNQTGHRENASNAIRNLMEDIEELKTEKGHRENASNAIRNLMEDIEKLKKNLVIQYSAAGWYLVSNGRLYKQSATLTNFTEAERQCQNAGARLASTGIRDQAILKELTEELPQYINAVNVWVGLQNNNGNWTWSDGKEYNKRRTPWLAGEPNSLDKSGVCGYLYKWSDLPDLADGQCSTEMTYLCERDWL